MIMAYLEHVIARVLTSEDIAEIGFRLDHIGSQSPSIIAMSQVELTATLHPPLVGSVQD